MLCTVNSHQDMERILRISHHVENSILYCKQFSHTLIRDISIPFSTTVPKEKALQIFPWNVKSLAGAKNKFSGFFMDFYRGRIASRSRHLEKGIWKVVMDELYFMTIKVEKERRYHNQNFSTSHSTYMVSRPIFSHKNTTLWKSLNFQEKSIV